MDIIYEYLIDTYVYLQLPPVVIGLLLWKRFNFAYKLFILLLLYTVLNELFKWYYGNNISINQNKIFSNLWNSIYFGFLFWLFFKKCSSKILKKTILIISAIFILSMGYELLIESKNYYSQSQVKPYIVGGFGILICVFLYFVNILQSKSITTIYFDLLFWIAIAHFIYYLGFTPFKVGENYFASFEKYHHLFNIKIHVTFIKSIILSIGFIVCSRQKVQ
ncbi:MAG: hypothetical protein ACPG6B_09015 [Oceanihabitans sp.]